MTDPIGARDTPWNTVLLVCGKCSRKMDGGYGAKGRDPLRSVLRAALKVAGAGRGVRVIETRCMGVCPRKAVVALNASRPQELLTVPKGTAVEAVVARLVGPAAAGRPDQR